MNLSPEFLMVRAIVLKILLSPEKYDWTLQGFGMLRLHLPNNYRLHVWEPAMAFGNVSTIHDHLQWGLESTIISGSLLNYCFLEDTDEEEYEWSMIQAGPQGGLRGESKLIRLRRLTGAQYKTGESYSQAPRVIHETVPQAGTVTLMRKFPTLEKDAARVFWKKGTEWGTAEPRTAPRFEIRVAIEYALTKWQRLPGEEFGV